MVPPSDTSSEGTDTRTGCAADTRVEPDEWQSSRAARTAGDDCLFVIKKSLPELLKSKLFPDGDSGVAGETVEKDNTRRSPGDFFWTPQAVPKGFGDRLQRATNKKPGVFRHPGSRWCCFAESWRYALILSHWEPGFRGSRPKPLRCSSPNRTQMDRPMAGAEARAADIQLCVVFWVIEIGSCLKSGRGGLRFLFLECQEFCAAVNTFRKIFLCSVSSASRERLKTQHG